MLAYNTGITGYLLTGLKPHEIMKKYPRAHMIGGLKQTKDKGWIQIAGHRPKAIEKLKEELGVEEVTQEIFEKLITEMTRNEIIDYLVKIGMPVAPVYDLSDIEDDPQVKARNMIIEVDHPKAGKIKTVNFPIKFSETPVDVIRPAPTFGEHNKEVLKSLLGYSEEKIRELEKEGVIAEG
jgi:crotonobetainyl-CoA:carnitine CoA-transferase CaiB-like acyl-CoA transferase